MNRLTTPASAWVAVALAAFQPGAAFGQQAAGEDAEEDVYESEAVIVEGKKIYRSRDSGISPTLIYDLEYFQRFEPISAGDMLKRVPGVSFTSDIGEYDAPQLRGLETQYTQVLINGERIPGSGPDRSVFVDRIPAEIIDHIEIIRSPTPDLDSQGIGGTLNIVLKDGAALEGGGWRTSGIYYTQEESQLQGAGSVVYGGSAGTADYFLSANIQQRFAPKGKTETFFDDELVFDGFATEEDVRDSLDTAFAGSVAWDLGSDRRLNLDGAWLNTDRDEDEFSVIFDDELVFDESEFQHEGKEQVTYTSTVGFEQRFAGGQDLELGLGFSQFDEDTDITAGPVEDDVRLIEEIETIDTDDSEVKFDSSLAWPLGASHEMELGISVIQKDRDAMQTIVEIEDGEMSDETPGSGVYSVEETRIDTYIKDVWVLTDLLTVEYGARFENTELDQSGTDGTAKQTHFEINPSAHLIVQPNETNQFRVSVAKTVRRPSFNELVPFTDEDSPGDDQTTIGNPDLEQEQALGLDVGYEYRFVRQDGIFGVNYFYRDIDDKIELTQISPDLFTPDNVGDGETWGLEFDLSMPLAMFDTPNVSAFANYTYLDSEIDDPFTGETRQFNLQPGYVYNAGILHDLPAIGVNYGFSYQKQDAAMEFLADEVTTIEYGGNLEVFLEKALGESMVVRLTANNILDAKKEEKNLTYESLADRQAGNIDAIEFEAEETGPLFMLTLRGSF